MIYRMAMLGQNTFPLSYELGENEIIQIKDNRGGGDGVYELTSSNFSVIPEQRSIGGRMVVTLGSEISNAGNYFLQTKNKDVAAVASLNFNRKESEMKFIDESQLRRQFASDKIDILKLDNTNVTQTIVEARSGKPLWKLCIIFALAFLLIEVLLLRLLP